MSELAGPAHRATESLHSMIYFAPEAEEQLVAVGVRPGRMCYFASRSAPMGQVSAGVTAATFVNFNPELVVKYIPRAWTLASIDDILTARMRAADLSLRRLLGDAVDSAEMGELAELAREATTVLTPEGRPLYAGHAGLPWPDEAHLVMWHAATLLRESRGDGHTMALAHAGLSGIESIVTHTATGRGFTVDAAKALRGWSQEQWDGAVSGLQKRGLMDGDALTDDGVALRASIEAETDELDAAPWEHLGPDRTKRLVELGKGLTRTIVGNGAFSIPGCLRLAVAALVRGRRLGEVARPHGLRAGIADPVQLVAAAHRHGDRDDGHDRGDPGGQRRARPLSGRDRACPRPSRSSRSIGGTASTPGRTAAPPTTPRPTARRCRAAHGSNDVPRCVCFCTSGVCASPPLR